MANICEDDSGGGGGGGEQRGRQSADEMPCLVHFL